MYSYMLGYAYINRENIMFGALEVSRNSLVYMLTSDIKTK